MMRHESNRNCSEPAGVPLVDSESMDAVVAWVENGCDPPDFYDWKPED